MYPRCRLHTTAHISRMGRIRPPRRPYTVQSGRVDSYRDEGARPAPRRIQERDHHLHQRASNWELSTPMIFPFSDGAASPPIPRAVHKRLNYRTHGASPPLNDETSVTEAGYPGGVLRTWLVETRNTFIRRTQGRCGAAKVVINDVLSRGVEEASMRNGDAYRNDTRDGGWAAGVHRRWRGLSRHRDQQPASPATTATTRVRRRKTARRGTWKRGWRVRWKWVLSIPTFKSPLAETLSRVVMRAQ